MRNKEIENSWEQEAEEVILGIKDWRLQDPKATFKEIEEAVDASLARARARPDVIGDVALASKRQKRVVSQRMGVSDVASVATRWGVGGSIPDA